MPETGLTAVRGNDSTELVVRASATGQPVQEVYGRLEFVVRGYFGVSSAFLVDLDMLD
jgi:hypothetical protein